MHLFIERCCEIAALTISELEKLGYKIHSSYNDLSANKYAVDYQQLHKQTYLIYLFSATICLLADV